MALGAIWILVTTDSVGMRIASSGVAVAAVVSLYLQRGHAQQLKRKMSRVD